MIFTGYSRIGNQMASKTVNVVNEAGIHCRPSSVILMAAQEFPGCKFKMKAKNGESDLRSMISLIALGIAQGEQVTIEAAGTDEEKACERIASLFAYNFDFPR